MVMPPSAAVAGIDTELVAVDVVEAAAVDVVVCCEATSANKPKHHTTTSREKRESIVFGARLHRKNSDGWEEKRRKGGAKE